MCFPKETKNNNFEAFKMVTNNKEAKKITKNISCDCKWKFDSTKCNSNQN